MHHELPAAARLELEGLEGAGEARRSPPAGQQVRPGEGFEHLVGRMGQHPPGPEDRLVPIRHH